MEQTAIIIPSFESLAELSAVVNALRAEMAARMELIVVASGASAAVIAAWCAQRGVCCIVAAGETGFAAAANKGMRLAAAGKLILLAAPAAAGFGRPAALAAALGAGGAGVAASTSADACEDGTREARAAAVTGISADCLGLTRPALERVGLLDGRFGGSRWAFADYLLRARLNGFGVRLLRERPETPPAPSSPPFARQQNDESDWRLFAVKWNIESLAIF